MINIYTFIRKCRCATNAMIVASVLTLPCMVSAVDLPVRTIGTQECFYYITKKGDTSFSVAKSLGITYSQLIKYNQWAADGITVGKVLYFPVSDFDEVFGRGNAQPELSNVDNTPTVNTHIVKDGETLFGISRKYDLSPDDVVRLNPWAATGLRVGQRLTLPLKQEKVTNDKPTTLPAVIDKETRPVAIEIPEQQDELMPVKPPLVEFKDEQVNGGDNECDDNTHSGAKAEQTADRHYNVALLLPFMLKEENADKRTALNIDFYRGLMLAADTLAKQSAPISFKIYDTGADTKSLNAVLSKPELKDASIIIAPSDIAQLQTVAKFGEKNGIYVLNMFAVKDSTHLTNSYVVQSYIDQQRMYGKAVDYVVTLAKDQSLTPVFLAHESGSKDKQTLVSLIKDKLDDYGIQSLFLNYDGTLTTDEITAVLKPDANYVVIPMSGTITEFNKFAPALSSFISKDVAEAGGSVITFGYPEWSSYKGAARDYLGKLSAHIYSRFFVDVTSVEYQGVKDAYKRWYGREMSSEMPCQALLGFDTGCYIIKSLNNIGLNPSNAPLYAGVQSSFKFTQDGVGLINNILYFIEYKAGGSVSIEIQ